MAVLSTTGHRQPVDRTSWIVFALVAVPTLVIVGTVMLLNLPAELMFVLPLVFAATWILRRPMVGLYGLVVAALMIPASPYPAPDAITDNLPFFSNLNGAGNQAGFGISPAEILMLLILFGILGSFALDRERQPVGRLMWPYAIFGAAVAMGEINGLVHGGDFKLSLWELRPQAYGLVVFLMAALLIRDRSQLKVLVGLLVVCELFRAVTADYRYFITFGRDLGNLESVLAHEDSFLMMLFFLVLAICIVWFRGPLLVLLIALSPVVFTAIVVNHRRAGLLELGLGVVLVMACVYVVEPRLRNGLFKAAVVMTVMGIAFLAVFWNQQFGSVAEVVRPIKSLFNPSARDMASDLYRIAESANLKATFRSSPLIGIGFGHPYYIFYPQSGVSKYDPLWNVIPHNTVLWIPMRMGIVGMTTFFTLISMAIIESISAMRSLKDRLVRAAVIFALVTMVVELFNGYVDVGLENYRDLIVLGLILAIISRAPYLAAEATSRGVTAPTAAQQP